MCQNETRAASSNYSLAFMCGKTLSWFDCFALNHFHCSCHFFAHSSFRDRGVDSQEVLTITVKGRLLMWFIHCSLLDRCVLFYQAPERRSNTEIVFSLV